ncbi:hypothetical protein KAI65_00825 [Candidatus Parcubacteria bacterium]|nr:hypothetical protein [Candidatus Parcubacteria bacterium]
MESEKPNAPNENTIKKCENILAELLKAHNFLSIKIIIRERPRRTLIKLRHFPLWINGVTLTTKDNEKIIIPCWNSFTKDITNKTNESELWEVAHSIQEAFYRKKNINQ